MDGTKRIRVVALGSAAAVLGWSETTLELTAAARLSDLIDRLESQSDRLAAARGRVRYAVNQKYANPAAELADGDEVAVIPPVSGG